MMKKMFSLLLLFPAAILLFSPLDAQERRRMDPEMISDSLADSTFYRKYVCPHCGKENCDCAEKNGNCPGGQCAAPNGNGQSSCPGGQCPAPNGNGHGNGKQGGSCPGGQCPAPN